MREANNMLLNGQFNGNISNTTPTNTNGQNYRTSSIDPLDFKQPGSLTQLLQVKESDILNDEDNISDTSSSQLTLNNNNSNGGYNRFTLQSKHQNPPLAKLRSPSTMSNTSNNFPSHRNTTKSITPSNGSNVLIKKRTASSTSSHSIYDTQPPAPNSTAASVITHHPPLHQQQSLPINLPQQYTTNYMTLSNPYKPTLKTNPTANYSSLNMNNSLDDLLMSNISSATNSSRVKKMSQIENALASVLDDMKQLDFSTGLSNNQTDAPSRNCGSSTTNTSSLSLSASVKVKNNSISSKTGPSLIRTNYNNVGSVKATNSPLLSDNSVLSSNKPRPDLVMDIPVNVLLSSPNQSNLQQSNQQLSKKNESLVTTTIIGGFGIKSRRLSVDNNGSDKEANSPSKNELTVKSSVSTTNGSPLPEASNGTVIQKVKEHLQSSSTTSTESSSDSSLASSSSISINSGHNLSANKVKANNTNGNGGMPMRLFNFDITAEGIATVTSTNGQHENPEEEKVKSPKLVHQQESYSKYGGKVELNSSGIVVKKQPPPLMKKPEKSDEILRKLGKSPPQTQQQQPAESFNHVLLNSASSISGNSTNSSEGSNQTNLTPGTNGASTTINIDINSKSDNSGLESPDDCGMSPSNCNKSNLSARLSNSKATDV